VNPLAAFQVITIGRFWVIPEVHNGRVIAGCYTGIDVAAEI